MKLPLTYQKMCKVNKFGEKNLDPFYIKCVCLNYTLFQIVKAAGKGKLATLMKSSLEAGPICDLIIDSPLCALSPL